MCYNKLTLTPDFTGHVVEPQVGSGRGASGFKCDCEQFRKYFIYLIIHYLSIYLPDFWTQDCPEGMCTNGTQVRCDVPSLPNPATRKGWPHHRGLRPLLVYNSDVGSFTSHKNKCLSLSFITRIARIPNLVRLWRRAGRMGKEERMYLKKRKEKKNNDDNSNKKGNKDEINK